MPGTYPWGMKGKNLTLSNKESHAKASQPNRECDDRNMEGNRKHVKGYHPDIEDGKKMERRCEGCSSVGCLMTACEGCFKAWFCVSVQDRPYQKEIDTGREGKQMLQEQRRSSQSPNALRPARVPESDDSRSQSALDNMQNSSTLSK